MRAFLLGRNVSLGVLLHAVQSGPAGQSARQLKVEMAMHLSSRHCQHLQSWHYAQLHTASPSLPCIAQAYLAQATMLCSLLLWHCKPQLEGVPSVPWSGLPAKLSLRLTLPACGRNPAAHSSLSTITAAVLPGSSTRASLMAHLSLCVFCKSRMTAHRCNSMTSSCTAMRSEIDLGLGAPNASILRG